MKVMVLGLDGATWDVLEPLIQDGLLPNLARLRERGCSGTLQSVFPPLSPVAWTGVMTGKNSGKHGIYEFLEHGHNPLSGRVNSSRTIQADLLWEIAARYGKKTVAGGVPMSYPARPARHARHAAPRLARSGFVCLGLAGIVYRWVMGDARPGFTNGTALLRLAGERVTLPKVASRGDPHHAH